MRNYLKDRIGLPLLCAAGMGLFGAATMATFEAAVASLPRTDAMLMRRQLPAIVARVAMHTRIKPKVKVAEIPSLAPSPKVTVVPVRVHPPLIAALPRTAVAPKPELPRRHIVRSTRRAAMTLRPPVVSPVAPPVAVIPPPPVVPPSPPAVVTPPPPESIPQPPASSPSDRVINIPGVEHGDIELTLGWNTKDDLDLMVMLPNGKLVYFRNKAFDGIKLDVDQNSSGSNITDKPVEHVNFSNTATPHAGTYKVYVMHWAVRVSSLTPFVMDVKLGETRRSFDGLVQYSNPHIGILTCILEIGVDGQRSVRAPTQEEQAEDHISFSH